MSSITPLLTVLMLAVLFLAVWRGGGPERAGGAILFASFLADELYHLAGFVHSFTQFDPVELAIDVASLAAFALVAVRANRLWPIFASALHSVAVLGHLVMLARSGQPVIYRAYWAMTEPPVVLGVLTLLAATTAHMLRQRRLGPYPDWRRS